jgi:hypothetical protein
MEAETLRRLPRWVDVVEWDATTTGGGRGCCGPNTMAKHSCTIDVIGCVMLQVVAKY